jgi:hypothetical protein
MKAITTAVIGFALLATTANGRAAELCAFFDDLTTLQTAAVQQRFMVSALACNGTQSYNAFVLGHQDELQKADRDLQSLFMRLNSATGADDYHAYKTRLANIYSLLSAQHKEEYCALTRAALERSQSGETHSLREFVLAQPLVLAAALQSCGESVAGQKFTILPARTASAPGSRTVEGAVSRLRGLFPGSDYFFFDGQFLRPLHGPFTDSFGRR